MEELAGSASLLLAALFALSGGAKLHDRRPLARALTKVLPHRLSFGGAAQRRLRYVVAIFALFELALAAALLVSRGAMARAAAVVVVALGVVFVVAVQAAIKKGAACGCWGSLSDGPAGGAELARAAGVSVVGVVVLAGRGDGAPDIRIATVAGACGLAVAWAVLAAVAGRRVPTPSRSHRVTAAPRRRERLRRGIVDFVLGPGGVDRRRRPPSAAGEMLGRDRRRLLGEVRADATVQRTLEVAAEHGGLDWKSARASRMSADPTGTPAHVVQANGPAGWLRAVRSPDGAVAVVAQLGNRQYLGVDGELRPQEAARLSATPPRNGLPTP